jgi:hypothetical protein
MRQTKLTILAIVSGAALTWAAGANASLVGDQIFVDRVIPSRTPPFSFCQEVYGSGPEGCAVTVTDGDSDRLALTGGNNFYVNVEATQIRFELGPDNGGGGPFDEHLVVFSDLDFLDTDFPGTNWIISGVTFETDLVGMDASRISYSDHGIVVNYADISYPGGQYLILTLQTSPIPEPTTFVLTTIAGFALPIRRRRQIA